MQTMEVRPMRFENLQWVRAAGEMDLCNAHELTHAVNTSRCNSGDAMVLDLTDLAFIDSTAVKRVMRLQTEMMEAGVDFTIHVRKGSLVHRVLDVVGVASVTPVAACKSTVPVQ